MKNQSAGAPANARNSAPNYIPLSVADRVSMLREAGAESPDGLFAHVPRGVMFDSAPDIGEGKSDAALRGDFAAISQKNRIPQLSFLGGECGDWKVDEIAGEVSKIRGLSTAYTPYQPERSQGTLITHWIYQCAMSALTGFEAVNCSLYDGASAVFEAAACACRLTKKSAVLACESLFPGYLETLETLARGTPMRIVKVPSDPASGTTPAPSVAAMLSENPDAACVIFPQVGAWGGLEDADAICDACRSAGAKSVAVIDPALLAYGALKPPSELGKFGADIAVGEGRHLASPPNFGGPGLGIFAVRFNASAKNDVRQAPGRFVGKALDEDGRECFTMVLSAREQHIRREKATSNICSNEAFVATLAGACMLAKSDAGMASSAARARAAAVSAFERICSIPGFSHAFGASAFFNEFSLSVPADPSLIISEAAAEGMHIGVEVRAPGGGERLLRMSFSDRISEGQILRAAKFLERYAVAGKPRRAAIAPAIPDSALRKSRPGLPEISRGEILRYYRSLGELNISPDDACYPLGSCTMKYNPPICDELAALPGFESSHPLAPECCVQGSLEILWRFSEAVKKITGLDAVACQPAAGAQGELCAIKMFQAWHRDNSAGPRDAILIPSTAHGTNFATAKAAGFSDENIIHVGAGPDGLLSLADLREKLEKYGPRVAAIMVTNPNTSGIFERDFGEIARMVHAAGGLVFMDGANFNAIAGRVNLRKMGVDAVHNNLHKTWAVSHGGGGPGDAFVAVRDFLADYIPSYIVEKRPGGFRLARPEKSIGSLHALFGNFANKIRALAYIEKLGTDGVRDMSATAVLASRYLFSALSKSWDALPAGSGEPRMHEFILTLSEEDFKSLESAGVPRQLAVSRVGKMFLDYGFHAPTVSFPETYGLMIEPTESYSKAELDRFRDAVISIKRLIRNSPLSAAKSPRFTPVGKIDEAAASRKPVLSEPLKSLPKIHPNRKSPGELAGLSISRIEDLLS